MRISIGTVPKGIGREEFAQWTLAAARRVYGAHANPRITFLERLPHRFAKRGLYIDIRPRGLQRNRLALVYDLDNRCILALTERRMLHEYHGFVAGHLFGDPEPACRAEVPAVSAAG